MVEKQETKKQKEDNEVVKVMIHMYCRTHHHPDGYLCPECQELLDYVHFRRSKCPWGDDKPFCAHCPIQCYKPVMKERIRKVMKFSGPLISFVHPVLGFKHIAEAIPYLYKKARGIAPKMPPKKVKPKTDETKTKEVNSVKATDSAKTDIAKEDKAVKAVETKANVSEAVENETKNINVVETATETAVENETKNINVVETATETAVETESKATAVEAETYNNVDTGITNGESSNDVAKEKEETAEKLDIKED